MKIWKEKDCELRTSIGSFSDKNNTLNIWAKFSAEIFQTDGGHGATSQTQTQLMTKLVISHPSNLNSELVQTHYSYFLLCIVYYILFVNSNVDNQT